MPPQLTLQHFSLVLAEYGFSLNHWKCKFYCSRSLLLGNTRLHDQGFIIGMTTCQFLQPSLTKARNKFCFLKHLLRRRTPAVGRAKLMDKAVTNSLKWCLGAIPPKNIRLDWSMLHKPCLWVGCLGMLRRLMKHGLNTVDGLPGLHVLSFARRVFSVDRPLGLRDGGVLRSPRACQLPPATPDFVQG